MDEFPMVDVLKVRALDEFKLWLRFSDGCEGVRDLSDLVKHGGPMVEPLRAPEFFARVSWKWRSDLAKRLRPRSHQSLHEYAEEWTCGTVAAARADDPDPLSHAGT